MIAQLIWNRPERAIRNPRFQSVFFNFLTAWLFWCSAPHVTYSAFQIRTGSRPRLFYLLYSPLFLTLFLLLIPPHVMPSDWFMKLFASLLLNCCGKSISKETDWVTEFVVTRLGGESFLSRDFEKPESRHVTLFRLQLGKNTQWHKIPGSLNAKTVFVVLL